MYNENSKNQLQCGCTPEDGSCAWCRTEEQSEQFRNERSRDMFFDSFNQPTEKEVDND